MPPDPAVTPPRYTAVGADAVGFMRVGKWRKQAERLRRFSRRSSGHRDTRPDVPRVRLRGIVRVRWAGRGSAVTREDFLKVVPKRRAFFVAAGLAASEVVDLEETALDQRHLLVKARWMFRFEKHPSRPVVEEGAATYVLRRQEGGLAIIFQLDHQDLTKRVQELGLLEPPE